MPDTAHPRSYRLTRVTPGIGWGRRTHSYHRTKAAARETAARFFGGCEFPVPTVIASKLSSSSVRLAERLSNGAYETIAEWSDTFIGPTGVRP